jgi:hypothetical protein
VTKRKCVLMGGCSTLFLLLLSWLRWHCIDDKWFGGLRATQWMCFTMVVRCSASLVEKSMVRSRMLGAALSDGRLYFRRLQVPHYFNSVKRNMNKKIAKRHNHSLELTLKPLTTQKFCVIIVFKVTTFN